MLREILNPTVLNSKEIVCEPKVIRTIGLTKLLHLCCDAFGRTCMERIAVDRLGAPVASVRTTTAGHKVHGKEAVRFTPGLAVPIDISEISRGERKLIEIAHESSRSCSNKRTVPWVGVYESANVLRVSSGAPNQRLDDVKERPFGLTEEHIVSAFREVFAIAVGRIGTIDHDLRSSGARGVDHGKCDLPHTAEAHLRKEIEIIFVDCNHSGPRTTEDLGKSLLRIFQHAVEEGDGEPLLAEKRRRIQRAERRIGLHLTNLFAIVVKVVRMGQQNVNFAQFEILQQTS